MGEFQNCFFGKVAEWVACASDTRLRRAEQAQAAPPGHIDCLFYGKVAEWLKAADC
jgi:hypothetical protein